ncbi:MAG TPA: ABC transporter substrate-binding protein [Chloroflexota bacterium]|nr:ABC transporter substrate-binding protein [Chloroflexota bacterium]
MKRCLVPMLLSLTVLSACGGAAVPASSTPAAASPAASKPAASTSAAAGGAASAKPAASSSTANAAGKLVTVQAAYPQISAVHTPMYVAKEQGFYAQNGLDVQLKIVQGPAETASLISGELQFGDFGGNELTDADLGGANLVGIATLADVPVFSLYADKKYKTMNDLVGQSIGVTALGTTTSATAELFLKHFGLQDKVKIVGSGGTTEGILAALTKGLVAAAIVNPASAEQAKRQGFIELVNGVTLGVPLNYDVIAVSRDYLKAHPDQVNAFLKGYAQGWAYSGDSANKAGTMAAMQKYSKFPNDLAEISYQSMLPVWSGKKLPTVDPEGIANVLTFSKNPKAKDAKPEQFIDNSLLEAVAR